MHHFAAALEDHAIIDTQAGRKNITPEDGRLVDLHTVLGTHAAADFAADNDSSGIDLALNSRPLADNQGVWRVDLASEGAADSNSPLKTQLPLEFAALIEDSGDCVVGNWDVKRGGFCHLLI